MKYFKIPNGNSFRGEMLNDSLIENQSVQYPMTSGALSTVACEISGLLFFYSQNYKKKLLAIKQLKQLVKICTQTCENIFKKPHWREAEN